MLLVALRVGVRVNTPLHTPIWHTLSPPLPCPQMKKKYAGARPYGEWLAAETVTLSQIVDSVPAAGEWASMGGGTGEVWNACGARPSCPSAPPW